MSSPIRVLIVEDDPDSSNALQLLLEHEGFAVDRAASVHETREHLDACRRNGVRLADVIVLDLGLPDFSPIELAEEFRRLDPPPAIIVHSAAPREIVHAAAVALGAVGKVRKPSNCHELIGLIRAAAEHALPAIR